MNFYPFHVGDYMLRTAHLEPLEDLAYRRLIDLYYVNEQPIAGTPAEVARIIRLRSAVAEVESVLREFFTETASGWQHSHCDEVIQQYQAKAKVAAENGKRGGRPRKNPAPSENNQAGGDSQSEEEPKKTQSVIPANPDETGSKTNQEPITNNQSKEPPIPPEGAAAGFAEFWSAYPLKKAKATAEKAWAKLKPSADLQASILSAIAAHKLSADWQRDGGQYIPHPTTWLNQRRWEDEVTHARSQRPDQNRPRSAVDEVREAIWRREAAEAAAAAAGQAVVEDGGDLRPALDGEFRRVG